MTTEGKKYCVYKALWEEFDLGHVWISDPGLHMEPASRPIVKISVPDWGKSVYCEALTVDPDFRERLKNAGRPIPPESESAVVINAWYRRLLGLSSDAVEANLLIVRCDSLPTRFMACLHHPQVVVRIATWLGILSVGLGLLGVALGALSQR